MANDVLVGSDVKAYALYPNGQDGFPGLGASVNVLGVYKSIKITFDVTRAKVKPSSQVLVEKRLIDFDWSATLEHQVRSGGALALNLAMNVAVNVMVQFQEESGGWWWTLYGGIQRGEYNVVNEERTEMLTIENIGAVGVGNASIYYSSGPVSVSQAVQMAFSGAVPTFSSFSSGH